MIKVVNHGILFFMQVESTANIIEKNRLKSNSWIHIYIWLGLLLILFFFSLYLGRYPIKSNDFFEWLYGFFTDWSSIKNNPLTNVFIKLRFPRILTAVITGAALAAAGAAYQGIFCNPMVSPDILGASAGAGFGAAVGILLALPAFGIQITAFIFGLIAVGLSVFITASVGRIYNVVLVLVLSGMIVSSMFGSFVAVAKYVADPYRQLPEITFWLMGSLSSIDNRALYYVFPIVLIGIILLYSIRWRINIMTFGDEEARALGINTRVVRLVVIAAATLITSSVVSLCGQIAWVGLIIPHLSRMIIGPDYNKLLPLSILMGGVYLLAVDDIARTAMQTEIPLGILTSLIGAPFFIYLLLKSGKRKV